MRTEGDSILSRYLVLSGANLAAAGLSFAVVWTIVQRFGAGGLGDFSLALSISSYALLVATCGTDVYAVKQLAADRATVGTLTTTVLLVRAGVGSLTYLTIIALLSVVPRLEEIDVVLAVLGLSSLVSALNMVWVAQAKHRTHIIAVATLATQTLYLALAVAFLWSGSRLWGIAAARVIAELVVALGSVGWIRRQCGGMQSPMRRPEFFAFAAESAPIAGTQLLRGMTLGSDVLILGFMVDRLALGHYSAAARVFLLMMTLAGAYFLILLPRFAERADSSDAIRRELRASLRRSVPPVLLASVSVIIFARPMLTIVFGAGFGSAAPALRLLAAALVANLVGRHYRQVLVATGRQVVDLRMTGIGAFVHIVAKLALIPALGITGAALGTLIGELTIAALLAWTAQPAAASAPTAGQGARKQE